MHISYSFSSKKKKGSAFAALAVTGLIVSGCAAGDTGTPGSDGSSDSGNSQGPTEVTLVTHDSFVVPQELFDAFQEETGINVKVLASGDAGALVNQLVLTKDAPIGDVVFGIDNNLAGRAIAADILENYVAAGLTEKEDKFLLPSAGRDQLTPMTSGDVCLNIDPTYFEAQGIAKPQGLDDLIKPEYRDLFVTPGASTSSPGLAFLLATIDAQGFDGWEAYWQALVDNGVKITGGWSDAYGVDFTAGGGDGNRPIVLSYGSSPAFAPETESLNDTCYRQVEYAGIVKGTDNLEAAKQVIDFLFSVEVQESIPENMWVFPANQAAVLPAEWAENVTIADNAYFLDPEVVEENREDWVMTWSQIATK